MCILLRVSRKRRGNEISLECTPLLARHSTVRGSRDATTHRRIFSPPVHPPTYPRTSFHPFTSHAPHTQHDTKKLDSNGRRLCTNRQKDKEKTKTRRIDFKQIPVSLVLPGFKLGATGVEVKFTTSPSVVRAMGPFKESSRSLECLERTPRCSRPSFNLPCMQLLVLSPLNSLPRRKRSARVRLASI